MKTTVVIPAGYFADIRDYLLDGSGNEFCCYLFSGVTKGRNHLKLLGRRLVLPDKNVDYEINSPVACKVNLYFVDNVLFDAPRENDLIQTNLSIIDIHSHPFAKGDGVSFSATDDQWQRECVEYFYNVRNYTGYFCFIVLGEKSFDGRVWYFDQRRGEYRHYPLDEITILDFPYRKWENHNKKRKIYITKAHSEMLNRQILAFGTEGQKVMSNVSAGIVGLGGIGSIAAEGLARLGVTRFVLVDHDEAEISNLNRCLGMTFADAISQNSKVSIAAREILSINPRAKVETVKASVFEKTAINKLKMVDFIVLGTDNLLSRAFINEFCLQYCIPTFSIGAVINVDPKTNRVEDIFGEYQAIIPGPQSSCLNCSGGIDYHEVSYLLGSPEVRAEGEARGYINVANFHQPAVRPLNGVITEMALSEIHNYFCGFKEEMIEGFSYDQKRHRLHPRRFLKQQLDENIGGVLIECASKINTYEALINGEGPFIIDSENDVNTVIEQQQLQESQESAILEFLDHCQKNLGRKVNCPYCGNPGIIGRGNNEALTDYR